jgi:RTX toxin RtxA
VYFVTGSYEGDEGDNTLFATGLGLWGSGVKMYGGNDTVYAASLDLDVYDTWGNLSVYGGAGFMDINKSAWGNMTVAGLAGTTNLQHIGRTGNINFGGAAASNSPSKCLSKTGI